jgi:hypothetical protein
VLTPVRIVTGETPEDQWAEQDVNDVVSRCFELGVAAVQGAPPEFRDRGAAPAEEVLPEVWCPDGSSTQAATSCANTAPRSLA